MNNKVNDDQKSLKDFFLVIQDPRIDRHKKHELIDILIIAVCAAICGATNWVEIEEFGEAKEEWFSTFLNLEHGIPSHDTFRRVFMLLSPDEFSKAFINWIKVVTAGQNLEQICIDGKALRGSFERGKSCSAIHMLNAFSTRAGLSLGQMKVDDKSNEIKALPKLLELINVKGHLVSADALHCQVSAAKKIREKQGDYLLGLKGNQKYLAGRVKEKFDQKSGPGSRSCKKEKFETKETGHGRLEIRRCTVMTPKEGKSIGVNPLEKWPDLNSLIKVENERTNLKTGETSVETRYYVSSLVAGAEDFLNAVRSHWQVENKLHWVLDVVFREDECRTRSGYAPENFAMLRQFALNLIRMEKSKKSIRVKQKRSGWDNDFLLGVLLSAGI